MKKNYWGERTFPFIESGASCWRNFMLRKSALNRTLKRQKHVEMWQKMYFIQIGGLNNSMKLWNQKDFQHQTDQTFKSKHKATDSQANQHSNKANLEVVHRQYASFLLFVMSWWLDKSTFCFTLLYQSTCNHLINFLDKNLIPRLQRIENQRKVICRNGVVE